MTEQDNGLGRFLDAPSQLGDELRAELESARGQIPRDEQFQALAGRLAAFLVTPPGMAPHAGAPSGIGPAAAHGPAHALAGASTLTGVKIAVVVVAGLSAGGAAYWVQHRHADRVPTARVETRIPAARDPGPTPPQFGVRVPAVTNQIAHPLPSPQPLEDRDAPLARGHAATTAHPATVHHKRMAWTGTFASRPAADATSVTKPVNVDASSTKPEDKVAAIKPPSSRDESHLLDAAQAALANDPEEALDLTNEHERRFKVGSLVQEREVIAVTALVQLQRMSEARLRANRFHARFPESGYWRRLRSMLGDAP